MRQRTEVSAKIVRPDHQRENPLPKSQVEKADGEEPSGEPHRPHEGVVFDSYFLHLLSGASVPKIPSAPVSSKEAPGSAALYPQSLTHPNQSAP